MTEPLPDTPEGQSGRPAPRGASRRAQAAADRAAERLRQAVATAEADRRLLAQGLPPADDPRWEGDPFGDGIVVEEYDERQFRLWALEDELTAAQQAVGAAEQRLVEASRLERGPASEGACLGVEAWLDLAEARERLQEARRALAVFRCEDDLPFTDGTWRLQLARFREAGRDEARREAEDAGLLAELARAVPRTSGDTRGGTSWTSFLAEVALARSWSGRSAARQVERALVLTEDLPRVHSALAGGVLPVSAARALVDVAAGAPFALRGAVDAVAFQAVGLSAPRVRDLAHKALLQADPEQTARRAARGAAERGVSLRPVDDERVEISMVGPALPGLQGWKALDADARALRRAGDPRTLAQLRFDLLLERMVAGHVEPVEPVAEVVAEDVDVPPWERPEPDDALEPTGSGAPTSGAHPDPRRLDGTVLPAPASPADAWLGDGPDDHDPDLVLPSGVDGAACTCGLRPPPDPSVPGWWTDRRFSRNVRVDITVPVTTARGLDDEPAWVAGYGWVGAPTVRQLLPAAELRRLAVVGTGQPGAGTVLERETAVRRPAPDARAVAAELERVMVEPFAVSDTTWRAQPQHDPSPALADLVRARDRYDDGPAQARVTADRAELDHDDPYRDDGGGGPTAAWNLVARGKRTHDLKHRGWRPTRLPDGTWWRSPAGQQALAPRHGDPPPPVTVAGLPDPASVARRDAALLRPDADA